MSQENVEIVRRIYAAVERGDRAAVLELYDPAVEMVWAGSPFGQFLKHTVYHGHDGLRAFIRERAEDWPDWEDRLEEVVAVGDQVVSLVGSRGLARGSGIEMARTHAALWSFRDARVVRFVWFDSREDAIAAADAGAG